MSISDGDNCEQDYCVLGHQTANFHDHFTMGPFLAQGKRWKTYICTENDTEVNYACKSIRKSKLVSQEDVYDIRREVQIMRHLSEYIRSMVKLIGAFEDDSHVYVVVELCCGGNLLHPVNRMREVDERRAAELFGIIAGVVAGCHFVGVMLRDVKLDNFMLAAEHDDFSLKAIDFGSAIFCTPGHRVTDQMVGHPYFIAPEVISMEFGLEADVWSAGVTLYFLLSGVLPFRGDTTEEILDAVLKGYVDFDSEPWSFISDSAKDLVSNMLCLEPLDRLTAHEVMRHRWIYENDVDIERAMDYGVLYHERMVSQDEIDYSDIGGYGGSQAGYQHSDRGGSEYNATFDEPTSQRVISRQQSDDFVEEVDQIQDGDSNAENEDLSRAKNKSLMSENEANHDKGSRESTKPGETSTMFGFESVSFGSYFNMKNFFFWRQTKK